jgi:16S rRNA (cytosine967-C5)-methyltransferase
MTAEKKTGLKKTPPRNRASEISLARKAAFDLLLAVERGQSHSDDLLRGRAVSLLMAVDQHLATTLVLGVLRWQIRLDHQLQALLQRPNAKLDPEVRIALRLGAFQLLHLDRIPARAAIDESVELTKQSGHRFASAMVNAVLRKVASAKAAPLLEESAADLALTYAHPAWLVERWVSAYGLDRTRNLCRHGQTQPTQSVRLSAAEVEPELNRAGVQLEPGEILSGARTLLSGDLAITPAFLEGRARIQDEGSQLIGEIATASLAQQAEKILDACAAPGGKTLILAERNPNVRIVACESSAPRFEQLQKRLAAHSARIECRHADATTLPEESVFDLVLADVPCSGTGTLGRNPEIRHRLKPEDLTRQSQRQRELLTAALRLLRPGGRVVYSTCSLEPEENEEVIAAVLAATPHAHQLSLEDTLDALAGQRILTTAAAQRLRASITPEGALRLLPGAFQTDGFFVALIEKTE